MRSMRALPLLAAATILTSCATFEAYRPPAPSAPPQPCPASITAPLTDEPLAPEGVPMSALPPEVSAWWFGDLLPWSRELAHRLAQGQAWCAARR